MKTLVDTKKMADITAYILKIHQSFLNPEFRAGKATSGLE
jgi:hypothetical protein